jgi:hypothetical protein
LKIPFKESVIVSRFLSDNRNPLPVSGAGTKAGAAGTGTPIPFKESVIVARFLSDNRNPLPVSGVIGERNANGVEEPSGLGGEIYPLDSSPNDRTDSEPNEDTDPIESDPNEETEPTDCGLSPGISRDILLDAIVESSLPIVDSPVVEPSS